MTREQASSLAYTLLKEHKLDDWKVRLSTNLHYLGKCVHSHKVIYLNTHQIDTHPDVEVEHTIRHEIAHALTPGHSHDDIWGAKALELGCTNTATCGPALSSDAIDAIRSGHVVEVEFTEEIIRKPKYTITQLRDKCTICGKVAKEKSHTISGNFKIVTLECGHLTMRSIPKQTPFHELVSLDADKNCKHEWNSGTRCTKCPAAKLFKFQIEGARFIETAFGRAGIFDEMGLGKTVQTLAYLRYHPEAFPVLFIVKSGIKYQWLSEIFRWLGDKYFAQVISTSKERLVKGLNSYIISYDLLRRYDINQFAGVIKTVILDECQLIKNPDSSRTQNVRRIVAKVDKLLGLSGTPWKNRGSEFFPILNMLDATRFGSHVNFVNRWVDYYYDGAKQKEGGIRNIKEFKEYIKDIVIRRERADVDAEFPDLNRVKFHTVIDDVTREAYDEEVSEFVKFWNQVIINGEEEKSEQAAIARLQRMRHMLGLAKIPASLELIEEFIENTDRKIVIFVHHIDVGQIIHQKLLANELVKERGYTVLKLTGGMNSEDRFDIQEEFNRTQKVIMVASTLASGEGLNLQTCSDCIIHERQWNPANEEQVEGRFIRIGSEANKVNSTYVHAESSIDIKLDALVEKKRIQFHNTMNKGEMQRWDEKSLMRELMQSICDDYRKKVA